MRTIAGISLLAPIALGIVFRDASARADTVAMPTGDCRQLVNHVPAPDVEYKPGVDVHGKAVVPADLGSSYPVKIPETIDIQIGVNLAHILNAQQANASATSGSSATAGGRKPFSGYAPIGTLSIKGNQAFWNGVPIQPQDQAALAEACSKGLNAAGVTLPTEKPATPP